MRNITSQHKSYEGKPAAVLRDKEKQLLADKTSRQESWAAAHADLPSLTEEVERLRGLLGQPGIKPHDGAA